MPSSRANKKSSPKRKHSARSKRSGGAKQTVEVPDGEGWTRTVEVPVDPNPMNHDRDVTMLSAHQLGAELKQIKISIECGPGDTKRRILEARERAIHHELGRRNHLLEEALEREERLKRIDKRPLIADVKVETKLATHEVATRIEYWLEATRTGKLDHEKIRDVGDLVHAIHQECEEWFEVLEDR